VHRIGGDLAELGNETRFLGAGDGAAVQADDVGDAIVERAADRALVVLDEVEVARRDADARRQLDL
jgi:hypothetical protein